ncbi:MAG: SDR family NAD(P)-dependent oxidoreductase [Acidimicrobiales bacterium]|nr:SDR family NAD(P)-dependent oxidoreductase [Acidimicrobiales bacterium]MDP6285307.1 SDR family NAD(P)-dependent oxidoreductase [Acidimicrobiales bacterium]HJL91343.1 SDR family NAD(P)-dependent oxidoreductase [Acidimicrobiales bacterium]HJO40491.1 SDR family NAD(P)-dependent oxidoreductase [Acidimicrobiales bacterium]
MSKWNKETTTNEILEGVDLSGVKVLVTGASGGLGEETSRALAAAGASVIMAARDNTKNSEAKERILSSHSEAKLELHELNLASLQDVRSSAEEFLSKNESLDLLVNNAGIMCTPFGHTTDGFEQQFGVNHLGHYLFTGLLMPSLEKSGSSRVVCLSSGAHLICGVNLDDPMFERRDYDGWDSYGQSKSANALFAREFDRRYAEKGVHAFSVHPGMIFTELGRHMTEEDMARLMERRKAQISTDEDANSSDNMMSPKTVEAGAATTVWACVDDTLESQGGHYLADCQLGVPLASEDSSPGSCSMAGHILDDMAAEKLWELSEELTGGVFK